jgi:putative transposase
VISLTGLGDLVSTKKTRETIKQVRIVPRSRQYVIEVVHERAAQQAKLDPTLFASVDLGVSNLAALTSNAEHFTPLLVNGRPLKAWNQEYNKRRAALRRQLAQQDRFTSRKLEKLTEKRHRRIKHYLHVASHRMIDVLIQHRVSTLIIGLNPLWKQDVYMGKRHNPRDVCMTYPPRKGCGFPTS